MKGGSGCGQIGPLLCNIGRQAGNNTRILNVFFFFGNSVGDRFRFWRDHTPRTAMTVRLATDSIDKNKTAIDQKRTVPRPGMPDNDGDFTW